MRRSKCVWESEGKFCPALERELKEAQKSSREGVSDERKRQQNQLGHRRKVYAFGKVTPLLSVSLSIHTTSTGEEISLRFRINQLLGFRMG